MSEALEFLEDANVLELELHDIISAWVRPCGKFKISVTENE